MPNWCKNILEIDNNGEKVLELLELLKDEKGNLTFNKAVPMPKELEESDHTTLEDMKVKDKERLIELYGATNLYDWRCEKWGCKWDATESKFYKNKDKWIIEFRTPWGPPMKFMKTLSEMFKNITFTLQYADEFEGDHPIGKAKIHNGEIENFSPKGAEAEELWRKIWYNE